MSRSRERLDELELELELVVLKMDEPGVSKTSKSNDALGSQLYGSRRDLVELLHVQESFITRQRLDLGG